MIIIILYSCIALQNDFFLGTYILVQHIVGKLRISQVLAGDADLTKGVQNVPGGRKNSEGGGVEENQG